ncbi:BLUF domain-containing protein [Maribacter sp. X9]|uniref:BLUF domain-containing protein n=1 Tax=Maribacter sp. X9 TaxID=3402159 RepID=UPI003AF33ED8
MFSLVYRSTAQEDFNDSGIRKMLEHAKKNNLKKHITGCLLYHNNTFIQLLEGEEQEVRNLYRQIKMDSRHKDICVLHIEENINPLFSKFSMVYNNLDDLSDQIRHKRMLFDQIFHNSDIIGSPGSSKLILWAQVNKLLAQENNLMAS